MAIRLRYSTPTSASTRLGSAGSGRAIRQDWAMERNRAHAAVVFQARQVCENARREASGDGDRVNSRQPQQQDLSPLELPRLQQGFRAQPRSVQE
jgi:hypothetical protein